MLKEQMNLKVAIGTTNKAKVGAVEAVILQHEEQSEFFHLNVNSGVSEQPSTNEETRLGAINRAKNALHQSNADWAFGLEGGVQEIEGVMYCVNWGAVALSNGAVYTAQGASFMLPEELAAQLRNGKELGPLMDEYTNKENIRQHEGAIGVFTNGLINRKEMFEHIVSLLIGQVYFYETREML